MAEIVMFNHIPKTAGSTMRRVLLRAVGPKRVHFATTLGEHPAQIAEIHRQLDRPLRRPHAVIAHTGWGIEQRLPPQHTYRRFTLLREPIDRSVSLYFYSGESDRLSLADFIAANTFRAFNHQTAFLGGLAAAHHLDGEQIRPDQFDRELLETAKRNLETHLAVGLTERFDESLLLLGQAYEWPLRKTLYRTTNVGASRRRAPALATHDLAAVEESNELDLELYEFGRELFAAQLPAGHRRQLDRFQRLNRPYARVDRARERARRARRKLSLTP